MKRKIFIFICWAIILPILIIGSYKIILLFNEVKDIKLHGLETTGIIIKKWRGKCGSGYGNSTEFVMLIKGVKDTFTSSCDVPNEVKIGDKYLVKYLKNDPSKNLVLYDQKIK